MTKRLAYGSLMALSALLCAHAANGAEVFTFDCDANSFGGNETAALTPSLGELIVTPTGNDPYVSCSLVIDGTAMAEFALALTVTNAPADGFDAALVWTADGGEGRAPFTLDNGTQVVRFNVADAEASGDAAWDASITGIRLDLPDVADTDMAAFIDGGAYFALDWLAISDDAAFEPEAAFSNTDCDEDGLSNDFETGLGTDPLLADTDGDGVDDGTEISNESDPLDAGSTATMPAMNLLSTLLLLLLVAVGGVAALRGARFAA